MIRADFKKHAAIINGTRVKLSPIQFLIFITVWMRGRISDDALRDILWGNCIDGGPISDIVPVHIHLINRRLKNLPYRIISRSQVYEIQTLQVVSA